jgi:hypothetical protein
MASSCRTSDDCSMLADLDRATVLIAACFYPCCAPSSAETAKTLEAWDDGRIRVRVSAHMPVAIAEKLATRYGPG